MERISNNTTNLDGLGVKSNMLIYIYKPKGKIVTVRTKKGSQQFLRLFCAEI